MRGGGTLLLVGEESIIRPIFPAPNPAPGSVSNGYVNDLLTGFGTVGGALRRRSGAIALPA